MRKDLKFPNVACEELTRSRSNEWKIFWTVLGENLESNKKNKYVNQRIMILTSQINISMNEINVDLFGAKLKANVTLEKSKTMNVYIKVR